MNNSFDKDNINLFDDYDEKEYSKYQQHDYEGKDCFYDNYYDMDYFNNENQSTENTEKVFEKIFPPKIENEENNEINLVPMETDNECFIFPQNEENKEINNVENPKTQTDILMPESEKTLGDNEPISKTDDNDYTISNINSKGDNKELLGKKRKRTKDEFVNLTHNSEPKSSSIKQKKVFNQPKKPSNKKKAK